MAKKICIDAGHYGKYNRSPVNSAYYESDMAWKLHLLLKKYLEQYGFIVTTTRASQDKDLALTSRGRASKGCDLFVSLHSNACSAEPVDRPVVIYLVDDNCGPIDETSRALAQLLADTIQEVMQTSGKAQTYSRLASTDRDGDGQKNDDYYGVLYGAHQVGTPGLILEHGFHTNARCAAWLLDESNLDTLAKAEAEVIARYFGVNITEEKEEPEMTKFNTIEEVPDWGKETVQKLMDSGALLGTENGLELSEDMLRILVILDRLGKL